VSATTTTALPVDRHDLFTPGIFSTLAASKLLSLPPITGQARTVATSMPGIVKSMP